MTGCRRPSRKYRTINHVHYSRESSLFDAYANVNVRNHVNVLLAIKIGMRVYSNGFHFDHVDRRTL